MADENGEAPGQLKIRKYPNRRYYDATRSRHVTLEEIHSLIREGYEVQVTDSRSGERITQKVLAQIILELDPPKLDAFPAALLHGLIRANQTIVRDFIEKYFNQALSAFLRSQKQFESYLRQALGLQGMQTPGPNWAQMMLGPFSPQFWQFSDGAASARSSNQREGSAQDDLRSEVEALRRQLASLQEKLDERQP